MDELEIERPVIDVDEYTPDVIVSEKIIIYVRDTDKITDIYKKFYESILILLHVKHGLNFDLDKSSRIANIITINYFSKGKSLDLSSTKYFIEEKKSKDILEIVSNNALLEIDIHIYLDERDNTYEYRYIDRITFKI